MKRELKGVDSTTAVRCLTEDLAKQILKIAHDAGYKWSSGDSYLDKNCWRKNLCYNLIGGTYCAESYYQDMKYKIITAEEFIKLNTENKMKKEEIAVSIRTAEQAKRAYQILTDARQPIREKTAQNLSKGDTEWKFLYFHALGWSRYDYSGTSKQLITLDELEELLGVKKQEFKVGDRVRVVSCPVLNSNDVYASTDFKDSTIAYTGMMKKHGIVEGYVAPILSLELENIHNAGYVRIADQNGEGWSVPLSAVELVTEPKQAEAPKTLSISRANLKRVYDIVCTGWKQVITETIAKHNQFEDSIVFDLAVVRKGYSQANDAQVKLLKEVFPLPKVKRTVEVTKYINIHKSVKTYAHDTKEKAIEASKDGGNYDDYLAIGVEVKGSYTTEERDEVEEGQELLF